MHQMEMVFIKRLEASCKIPPLPNLLHDPINLSSAACNLSVQGRNIRSNYCQHYLPPHFGICYGILLLLQGRIFQKEEYHVHQLC